MERRFSPTAGSAKPVRVLLRARIQRVALASLLASACSSPNAQAPAANVSGAMPAGAGTAGASAQLPSAGAAPPQTQPSLDASLPDGASAPDRTGSAGAAGAAAPTAHMAPADDDAGEPHNIQPDAGPAPGPASDYVVGTIRIEIAAHDGRKLPVQLWYPAVEAARAEATMGHPTQEFEPEGQRRTRLTSLITTAPQGCTNRTMHAAIAAQPNGLAAHYPLLVVSHHHSGVRFATFSISERLASLGFVVAAPDHEGDTIYDDALQQSNALTADFLQVRAADVRSVIDVLLDASSTVVPDGIRGQLDAMRIGAFGHSLGSLTTGVAAVADQRVKAAAFIAQTPTIDLLGSPSIASFRVPALYMLAEEDTTNAQVTALYGTDMIRKDFADQKPPAWLIDVRDTAHWSFADDCALTSAAANGCGGGIRPTDGTPYTNLDNAKARELASRYVAAFFANQFLGRPVDALNLADPANLVKVSHHAQQ